VCRVLPEISKSKSESVLARSSKTAAPAAVRALKIAQSYLNRQVKACDGKASALTFREAYGYLF
jgi:hypothetical protein